MCARARLTVVRNAEDRCLTDKRDNGAYHQQSLLSPVRARWLVSPFGFLPFLLVSVRRAESLPARRFHWTSPSEKNLKLASPLHHHDTNITSISKFCSVKLAARKL
jgi:hypothetical protein